MNPTSDRRVVWYIPRGTKEEDFEEYRPRGYEGGANDEDAYKVFCVKRFAAYHEKRRKKEHSQGDVSLYKREANVDTFSGRIACSGSYSADRKEKVLSSGRRIEHVTFESVEVDDDGHGYKHYVCESCGSVTGCMCSRPKKEELVKKRILRGDSNASHMLLALGRAEDVARRAGDTETLSALSDLIKDVARKSEASDVDLRM